jgi:hypothetical protein
MTALDKPGCPRGVLGRLRRAFDDVHAVHRYLGHDPVSAVRPGRADLQHQTDHGTVEGK